MSTHRNPVIVWPASTEGVYYAICRACGDHSPVVADSEQALEILDRGGSANACRLQRPLFAPQRGIGEERVCPAAG